MSNLTFRMRVALDAAALGPQRRRRSMDRALRRLDRLPESSPVTPHRRRHVGASVIVTFAVAVAGVLVWQAAPSPHGSAPQADVSGGTVRVLNAPTTTKLTSMKRLLPAPQHVPASRSFAALYHDGGHPVRWEPCRPIHYVIRKGEEPAPFDSLLQRAIREVSSATGLSFVSDGTTAEQLLFDPTKRLPYQPQRYGNRWAPVLISWSSPAESPQLAGTEAGFAAPVSWSPGSGPQRMVSGTIAFSLPDLNTLYARPQGALLVRDVILHELAHLAGLAHVKDKSQLMFPTLTHAMRGYGAGDLAGLGLLGNGACFADY